jgi:hypothetical protein
LNEQDKLDVIEEAPVAETSESRVDGYVEADSISDEIPIDETQVGHFSGVQESILSNFFLRKTKISYVFHNKAQSF